MDCHRSPDKESFWLAIVVVTIYRESTCCWQCVSICIDVTVGFWLLNTIALRKAKIVYSFGLCSLFVQYMNRVNVFISLAANRTKRNAFPAFAEIVVSAILQVALCNNTEQAKQCFVESMFVKAP